VSHPPDYTPPGTPESEPQPISIEAPGRANSTPTAATPAELPSVTVIVLNYNGLRHLEPCFISLVGLDYPSNKLDLLLVDNASSDGSVGFMRDRFPEVAIVETGSNLGFAAGNNYGAERASGEYVAFLNNDTRVEPNWLIEMVKSVLAGRPSGIVCTSSLMLDWEGKSIDFQAAGVNFHGFGFQPSWGKPYVEGTIKPRDILFACGGSMLIDRAVFLAAGGFDPDYFAFFEDVDLGWRLWLLGYRVTLTPTAITYHRHHGTAGQIPGHRMYVLYERNALYTIYKNYDERNIDRILSAALLLLGQRTVRYLNVTGDDLSDYDWNSPERNQDVETSVHRNAVAALLAANEFADNLAAFRAKRQWVQERRVRTDEELFALFGQPGRVNWINHESDAPYAVAQHAIFDTFGLHDLWRDVPKQVLLISPDVLPVGDIPASGSGIRAWALGQGLEARGHHVHYTMPAPAIAGREGEVPAEFVDGAWTPQNLQSIIDSIVPDVVVSCGWPNVVWTPRVNVPLAIDLTGPHLLERAYQGHQDSETNSAEKVLALRQGDFFSCIGERQRYYFDAWLVEAGLTPDELETSLSIIPYSAAPSPPEHIWPTAGDNEQVRFVYGGIFLPWQNPAPALLVVTEVLEEQDTGVLEVIGGPHPFYPVHTGHYGPLLDALEASRHVVRSGLLPHDKLVERYRRAHVAVDVMVPNAERRLAFPSRTVHYLWCGLPVIHGAYSEVAEHIREYEAGWVVEHDDLDALREVVISVLANPSEAERRGRNAQRLAFERFNWNKTVEPLAKFVRSPHMRPRRREAARPQELTAAAATQRVGYSGPPAGFVVEHTWNKALPAKLQQVHARRREPLAQARARARDLLGALRLLSSGPIAVRVNGSGTNALSDIIVGRSHGQRFFSAHNGLSGVRVRVAVRGKASTSRLVLHLRAYPGAPQDIYSVDIPTYRLRDGQTVVLRFPPLEDSAGRWYYFSAESPDAVPGDAVSLYASTGPEGVRGQRYEDGLPAPGALQMKLEFNGEAQ
jgi:GT2 family glycosyltransferase